MGGVEGLMAQMSEHARSRCWETDKGINRLEASVALKHPGLEMGGSPVQYRERSKNPWHE